MRKFLSLLVVLLTTFTSAWADTKEYVNLGLPSGLLWATCNVGATNPQDYGDYFAWGETSPYYTDGNAQSTETTGIWKSGKENGYDWASYFDTTDGGSTFTKYNLTGGKTVLESANDAATQSAAWGAGWRMPTSAELLELAGGCFLEWTDDYKSTGVKGIIVYKNKNTTGDGDKGYFKSGTTWKKLSGTSYSTGTQPEGYVAYTTSDTHIFLPAAGCRYWTDLYNAGSDCVYWSSSLDTSSPGNAFGLFITSGDVNPQNSGDRWPGLSVRPVRNNYLCFTAEEATDISFNINGSWTPTASIQYSKDMAAWTDYSFTAGDNHTISLAAGEKVYFKATTTNSSFCNNIATYINFTSTGKVAASGNIMSLLDATCESKTIPRMFAFINLFSGCTTLTSAPELPATTLTDYCYISMFAGCTSLATAHELPATTLKSGCYQGMFRECTSLVTAPELPATTLTNLCYRQMFYGCTSLKTAPALPATTLAPSCYYSMFQGCTKLSKVTVNFTDWNTSGYSTTDWLKDAGTDASVTSRTFICPESLAIPETRSASDVPEGWTVTHYLCFTAEEATDVAFNVTGTLTTTPSLQYSKDMAAWTDYSFTAGDNHTISLAAGEKVYFKATTTNSKFSEDWDKFITFSSTKKVAASGNIMSLLDATCESTTIPADFTFISLFNGCSTLSSAPELPATELTKCCYQNLFQNCTSLTTAPELPAMTLTLANYCYSYMFGGCTSLATAPELPATKLAYGCYNLMFSGCTSLTTMPELKATELAQRCYYGMFDGCTSLTTAPELPAITLVKECYIRMFEGCTSLTTIPELKASELAQKCYSYMFSGCTNLIVNTAGPGTEWKINATSVGTNALTDMFTNTGGTLTGAPTNGTTYYIASLPAVKLNSKGYATYSSDKPFKVNTKYYIETEDAAKSVDVKAYKAKVNGEQIVLSEIPSGTSIPAGEGILLYTNDANSIGFAHFEQVSSADAITDNDLKPTTTATTPVVDKSGVTGTIWALDNENSFQKYTGSAFIANRAYLIHEPTTPPSAKGMTLVFGDETTGITSYENETLRYENENSKYIENGRIVILNSGKKFNAAGQLIK